MQDAEYPSGSANWYALWTRSNCEDLVFQQLTGKGFKAFLPKMPGWSRRGGRRHRTDLPMFPGYLFLHHEMGKESYIEVSRTRGLVGILGGRWDCLCEVPDHEIQMIRKVVESKAPIVHHPYLRCGQTVVITQGALTDLKGILVRIKPNRGLVVVSVHLLQRSVAVEVDFASVRPAATARPSQARAFS